MVSEDKWLDGDRWVIQLGWRDRKFWDGDKVLGTAPEAAWHEEMYDGRKVSLLDTREFHSMKPRPLLTVIERVRESETAQLAKIAITLYNVRTGETIPWDALQ